jgi:hypothetical protein
VLLEHFGIAHIAAQGLDRSVARLVHHLEKIDALRLAALVIRLVCPLQASVEFSVDVKLLKTSSAVFL